MSENVSAIFELAKKPLADDKKIKRVEIIILKYKEDPEVINRCISLIVHHTSWPYKLTIYDNRPNSANTAKIWNKLIKESTCEYICFIDSDAFIPANLEPCWLTRMMESIDQTGLVVPMGTNVGGSNRAHQPKSYPSFETGRGIWSGFCFLVSRYLFAFTGPFDERFYFYGQDSEFAFRSSKKGKPAIYRTDVVVQHLGSYSGKKAELDDGFDREADKLYAASLYRLCMRKS